MTAKKKPRTHVRRLERSREEPRGCLCGDELQRNAIISVATQECFPWVVAKRPRAALALGSPCRVRHPRACPGDRPPRPSHRDRSSACRPWLNSAFRVPYLPTSSRPRASPQSQASGKMNAREKAELQRVTGFTHLQQAIRTCKTSQGFAGQRAGGDAQARRNV